MDLKRLKELERETCPLGVGMGSQSDAREMYEILDLAIGSYALRAQVKEFLEMQHCDAVTMQRFQETYEYYRADSIKLRAALEAVYEFDEESGAVSNLPLEVRRKVRAALGK